MDEHKIFKAAYGKMDESISADDIEKIDDKVIEVETALENLSDIVINMLGKATEDDLEEGLVNEAVDEVDDEKDAEEDEAELEEANVDGEVYIIKSGPNYTIYRTDNNKQIGQEKSKEDAVRVATTAGFDIARIDEAKAGKKVSKKSMKISNLADLKHYITRSFSITGMDKKDVDELNAMSSVMQAPTWAAVNKILTKFHWDKKDMDDLYNELISFALESATEFLEKVDDAEEEDATDVDIEEVPEKCDKKKIDESKYESVLMADVVNVLSDELDIIIKANKGDKFVGLASVDDSTGVVFEKAIYVVYYDRAKDQLVVLTVKAVFPPKKLAGTKTVTGFKRG